MSYTTVLLDIAKRIDEHRDIPESLFKDLVDCLDDVVELGKLPYPKRYEYRGFVAVGGQGLLLRLNDKQEKQEVVCKFALPDLKRVRSIRNPFRNEHGEKFGIDKNDTELTARMKRGLYIQRQLAIKMIQKSAARLGYIPRVIHANLNSTKLYFTMEYMKGAQDLIRWCDSHNEQQIVELFERICVFVDEAVHSCGVVHSDLKHMNILVLAMNPVIIDFGIAKDLSEIHGKVTYKTVQCSTQYAPPHQQRNFANRDFQSDIYTLALTFWTMITKYDPDAKEVIDSLNKLYEYYSPGRLPKHLQSIFLKATKGRYEVIADMYDDIKEALATYQNKTTIESNAFEYEISLESIKKIVPNHMEAETIFLFWKGVKSWKKIINKYSS